MKPVPLILGLVASTALAAPPEPKFRAENLGHVEIGYGVAVADVDGDKRPDILLADKKQFVWFQNPGIPPAGAQTFAPVIWRRHVLAENLTEKDNVCIAAQDIDGDGKCEVAVGAEWNPGDTEKSGAVFYLIAPEDRTQKWEAVKFPAVEPTTHRMKWLRVGEKEWGLVVVPLHGRGNKNGQGAGVKTLLYHKPADPRGEWKSEVLDESLHASHNLEIGRSDAASSVLAPKLALGGREGVVHLRKKDDKWNRVELIKNDGTPEGSLGVGELRGGKFDSSREFLATVEPMHGNTLAVYRLQGARAGRPDRKVLTDQLNEGHALATGDILGGKGTEIVVGFRGNAGKPRPIGLRLWTALSEDGGEWRESVIDDKNMACEDLTLADLDGDGDIDIVASGRATKNLIIYWNDTPR
jgi:hypothetical protein